VRVLKADETLGGLADMGDHIEGMDRVTAYQLGHGRMGTGLRVEEDPHAAPLEERDTPAVAMHIRQAPRAWKPAKEKQMSVGVLQFIPVAGTCFYGIPMAADRSSGQN
jgi:hypothetical protein